MTDDKQNAAILADILERALAVAYARGLSKAAITVALVGAGIRSGLADKGRAATAAWLHAVADAVAAGADEPPAPANDRRKS